MSSDEILIIGGAVIAIFSGFLTMLQGYKRRTIWATYKRENIFIIVLFIISVASACVSMWGGLSASGEKKESDSLAEARACEARQVGFTLKQSQDELNQLSMRGLETLSYANKVQSDLVSKQSNMLSNFFGDGSRPKIYATFGNYNSKRPRIMFMLENSGRSSITGVYVVIENLYAGSKSFLSDTSYDGGVISVEKIEKETVRNFPIMVLPGQADMFIAEFDIPPGLTNYHYDAYVYWPGGVYWARTDLNLKGDVLYKATQYYKAPGDTIRNEDFYKFFRGRPNP